MGNTDSPSNLVACPILSLNEGLSGSVGKNAGLAISRLAVLASVQQSEKQDDLQMAYLYFNLQREHAEGMAAQAKVELG